MIDRDLTIAIASAGDIIVVDFWGGALPDFSAVRAMPVEPRRWWLIDAGPNCAAVAASLGDDGALTPIGGGLMRAILTGAGWRAQLMIGGAFDAENPGFSAGDCAATLLHHTPVWIDVIGDTEAHVYFAASYRDDIEHLWGLAASA